MFYLAVCFDIGRRSEIAVETHWNAHWQTMCLRNGGDTLLILPTNTALCDRLPQLMLVDEFVWTQVECTKRDDGDSGA